jgi:hypothetical protein
MAFSCVIADQQSSLFWDGLRELCCGAFVLPLAHKGKYCYDYGDTAGEKTVIVFCQVLKIDTCIIE